MKKMPTLYVRDDKDRSRVIAEINPGCEWVFDGEAVPTRKYDGTCVMLDEHGEWWARREVKSGKKEPENYVAVHYDRITGKTVGWEPIDQSSFAKAFEETFKSKNWAPGTYELCGPKINGNPQSYSAHVLVRHEHAQRPQDLRDDAVDAFLDQPRMLVAYLGGKYGWEGIVWHHPDGRMAKLKAKDLGSAYADWASLVPDAVTDEQAEACCGHLHGHIQGLPNLLPKTPEQHAESCCSPAAVEGRKDLERRALVALEAGEEERPSMEQQMAQSTVANRIITVPSSDPSPSAGLLQGADAAWMGTKDQRDEPVVALFSGAEIPPTGLRGAKHLLPRLLGEVSVLRRMRRLNPEQRATVERVLSRYHQ